MDDWTGARIVAALGIDVAPTAGYRGAMARLVNRVVDKVVAKPHAARPYSSDSPNLAFAQSSVFQREMS